MIKNQKKQKTFAVFKDGDSRFYGSLGSLAPHTVRYLLRIGLQELFDALLSDIKANRIQLTPEIMASVTKPEWRRELVEAICLRNVESPTDEEKK